MTNGVSFSLVAGACCVVKFTNGQTWLSNSYYSQTSPLSLNINSTGAKYFGGCYGTNGGMQNNDTSATFRSSSGKSGCRGSLAVMYESLCSYNGSVYIMHVTEPPITSYADYSDY